MYEKFCWELFYRSTRIRIVKKCGSEHCAYTKRCGNACWVETVRELVDGTITHLQPNFKVNVHFSTIILYSRYFFFNALFIAKQDQAAF